MISSIFKSRTIFIVFEISIATYGYQWYGTENDIPAVDMANATSDGVGSTNKEDRADYTDKSEPIREQDCIYCMACVAVCPTQSIKIEQSNTEFYPVYMRTNCYCN